MLTLIGLLAATIAAGTRAADIDARLRRCRPAARR
jgi:hypothetical protein